MTICPPPRPVSWQARQVFVPAAELSRAFYYEVARPLLGDRPHAAGLLGWGSDVLGYDTERSTDHGWGPRLLVFLDDEAAVETVQRSVSARLPDEYGGWPVRFGWDGLEATDHVTITTLGRWLVEHLGVDATAGMSTLDWLLTPQQRLLGVVGGAVHADETGAIASVRRSLSWYPDQVWRSAATTSARRKYSWPTASPTHALSLSQTRRCATCRSSVPWTKRSTAWTCSPRRSGGGGLLRFTPPSPATPVTARRGRRRR